MVRAGRRFVARAAAETNGFAAHLWTTDRAVHRVRHAGPARGWLVGMTDDFGAAPATTTPSATAAPRTSTALAAAGRLWAWPAELADLVWPRTCVACARPGPALCASCRGRDVVAAIDDLSAGPADVPVVAAAAYVDGVRRALISYKERGHHELARPLGSLLRSAVDFLLAGVGVGAGAPLQPPPWDRVVLVAVPSAPAEVRARGGQHVARLARVAVRGRTGRLAAPLRLIGTRVDSSALGVRERAGAPDRFAATRPTSGRRGPPMPHLGVVVVDDIVTSGATARDAVTALRRAGWPVLGVAAVAATPRPAPRLSPVAAPWPPPGDGSGRRW